MKERVI